MVREIRVRIMIAAQFKLILLVVATVVVELQAEE
jgi:hypothetical protein